MALLLAVSGYIAADLAGFTAHWMYLPIAAGLAVWLLSPLPGRAQGLIALVLVLAGSIWLISDLSGSTICSLLSWSPAVLSFRSPVSIAPTDVRVSTPF